MLNQAVAARAGRSGWALPLLDVERLLHQLTPRAFLRVRSPRPQPPVLARCLLVRQPADPDARRHPRTVPPQGSPVYGTLDGRHLHSYLNV